LLAELRPVQVQGAILLLVPDLTKALRVGGGAASGERGEGLFAANPGAQLVGIVGLFLDHGRSSCKKANGSS
jgi:hypothetical protein